MKLQKLKLLAGFLLSFGPAGCASTHINYGPFRYASDKDVSLQNVQWRKRNPDGSTEEFSADSVGGNASTVEAARWQTVGAAIDKIPRFPVGVTP
jgi:hypothetical protein